VGDADRVVVEGDSMMTIDYLTEPVEPYEKAIDKAADLQELREAVSLYSPLTGDALESVNAPGFDWDEWRRGLTVSRKPRGNPGEAWMVRYGAIPLPEVMLHVGMIAAHFNAPFGCAYIRSVEAGLVSEVNGQAVVTEREARQRLGQDTEGEAIRAAKKAVH
jgi:hypothetical protein